LLVAAPEYLKKHGPICKPGDLTKHPFIRVQSMFGSDQLPLKHVDSVVESAPIHPAVKTCHWRPMYELILAGVGIGVIEEPACAAALADRTLTRILPEFTVPPFDLHVLFQALKKCTPAILGRAGTDSGETAHRIEALLDES
jgi:DNA-binding transcriptional LysR family regulator